MHVYAQCLGTFFWVNHGEAVFFLRNPWWLKSMGLVILVHVCSLKKPNSCLRPYRFLVYHILVCCSHWDDTISQWEIYSRMKPASALHSLGMIAAYYQGPGVLKSHHDLNHPISCEELRHPYGLFSTSCTYL